MHPRKVYSLQNGSGEALRHKLNENRLHRELVKISAIPVLVTSCVFPSGINLIPEYWLNRTEATGVSPCRMKCSLLKSLLFLGRFTKTCASRSWFSLFCSPAPTSRCYASHSFGIALTPGSAFQLLSVSQNCLLPFSTCTLMLFSPCMNLFSPLNRRLVSCSCIPSLDSKQHLWL